MTCDEFRQLLPAYIDDELDVPTALRLARHLPDCPGCSRELEASQALSRGLAMAPLYLPAPTLFRDRLTRTIRAEVGGVGARRHPTPFGRWRWNTLPSGVAAGVLLTVGAFALLRVPASGGREQVADLVESHVRSLEVNHLLDVGSTDQHTVKPWFAGKLDFAPPVVDLTSEGFPLIGGRLDYVEQKKVAAIVYRRDKHVINLFIWPGDESATTEDRQGFHMVRFEFHGMVCWAVSDLNGNELNLFTKLFIGPRPASTRP